jgi:hypothetical protein
MEMYKSLTFWGPVRRPASEAMTWNSRLSPGFLLDSKYRRKVREMAAFRNRRRYLRGSTFIYGQG